MAELALNRSPASVERAIAAARDLLGMDMAYIGRIRNSQQVLCRIQGDSASFGLAEGQAIPWTETYCQHVLEGRLPSLMRDVRAHPLADELAVTGSANVGAYVSVPLQFSDGSLYGTLCAASHAPRGELEERDVNFVRVIALLISETLEREQVEEERQRLHGEAIAGEALIAAVEARDSYTGRHSRTVVTLSREVATRLGLSAREMAAVEKVALLHDIGKLAIPDRILSKPGALDEGEWEVMRTHPAVGARVVASIPGLAHLAPAIRAEHEHWDGSGYPDGLAGDDIPIASRIVLVCDAYDAMTSGRPYRDALPAAVAVAELASGAGTQFCPRCAQSLLAVLGESGAATPGGT